MKNSVRLLEKVDSPSSIHVICSFNRNEYRQNIPLFQIEFSDIILLSRFYKHGTFSPKVAITTWRNIAQDYA